MTALSIVLDIVLILVSLVLIAAVLMQQGQRQGLGAITGGAETFFGKSKGRSLDGKLSKITKICTVAFIVLAIATTIIVSHIGSSSTVDLDTALEEITESLEAETETEATADDAQAEATEAPADDAEAEATEAPAEDAEGEATEAPAADAEESEAE